MATALVSLLAAAIALLGAGIAWGQWYTARQKLALDLFERRLSAYVTFREALARLSVEGPQTYEQLVIIEQAAYEMRFLFAAHTVEKIRSVSDAAAVYHRAEKRFYRATEAPTRNEANLDALAEQAEIANATFQSQQRNLDPLMEPYLRMDQKLPRSPVERARDLVAWVRRRNANRPDGTT